MFSFAMASDLEKAFENLLYGVDRPKRQRRSASNARLGSDVMWDAEKPPLSAQHDEGNGTEWLASDTKRPPLISTTVSRSSPLLRRKFDTLRSKIRRPREDESEDEPVWDPSLLQLRPISGICALMLVVGCVVGSLVILMASDRQPGPCSYRNQYHRWNSLLMPVVR